MHGVWAAGSSVLLLLILVTVLLVSTKIHIWRGASQWSASIPLGGAPSLLGSCSLGRETALATVTTSPISQESVFLFPLYIFLVKNQCSFYKGMVFYFGVLLSMLVTKREPTLGYEDAYSVGTPEWAFGGNNGQKKP